MKQFFYAVLLLGFLAVSCTKEDLVAPSDNSSQLSENEGLKDFAVILSRAVKNEPQLRDFLKEEALLEFDNDYDVFYPWTKGKEVINDKTFGDIIEEYDYEGKLQNILKAVPKTTILIPDWSWVDENCFSVHTWDTSSDEVVVGFDEPGDVHHLYYDGELALEIPAGQFAGFPVLIVKSNERMNVSMDTKSGEIDFTFVDSAFDGTMNCVQTKKFMEGDLWNSENTYSDPCESGDNYISTEELRSLSPETIDAYEEFGTGWNGGVQRDFIYYGMSKDNVDNGLLNVFERDLLYRFSLSPTGIWNASDDSDDDPLKNLETYRSDRPDFDEVIRRMWANGNFDIKIEFFQDLNEEGASRIGTISLSIEPRDIMYIEKCHYTLKWGLFIKTVSTYSLSTDDIKSKWYYPGDKGGALTVMNTTWNLAKASDNIWVKISEIDDTKTYSQSVTQSFKHSASVQGDASYGDSKKIGLGVSGSYGYENTTSKTFNVTCTEGSDDLGTCFIEYVDGIVTDDGYYSGKGNGYQLKRLGNAYCSFSFIPIDIRNEYEITQCLRNRKPAQS